MVLLLKVAVLAVERGIAGEGDGTIEKEIIGENQSCRRG